MCPEFEGSTCCTEYANKMLQTTFAVIFTLLLTDNRFNIYFLLFCCRLQLKTILLQFTMLTTTEGIFSAYGIRKCYRPNNKRCS